MEKGQRRKRRHHYFEEGVKKRNIFNEEDGDEYEVHREEVENEEKEE